MRALSEQELRRMAEDGKVGKLPPILRKDKGVATDERIAQALEAIKRYLKELAERPTSEAQPVDVAAICAAITTALTPPPRVEREEIWDIVRDEQGLAKSVIRRIQ